MVTQMKKYIVIGIAVIIAVVLIIIFTRGKAEVEKKDIPKVTVKRGNIVVRIDETGEIQPKTTVEIKSKVSGKVVKLYVQENDSVRIGQLIADVEPDYNQARTIAAIKNDLRSSEIRHKDAQKNLQEGERLFNGNFISEIDYERLQDELEKAELDLELAQQQYLLIEDIETRDNLSKIYSTATGTVIERKVEEGEMVQSSNTTFGEGTVILSVADLSDMIVKSSINEVDIAKIAEKFAAEVKIDAFPYDSFTGVISKISASAKNENNVKVFPIEIEITQKDKRLRPGLSANVTIFGESKEDILVIPIRTIFSDSQGNDVVYKVVGDTIQTTATVIKTGINDLQFVEVYEGLEEDDDISLSEPN